MNEGNPGRTDLFIGTLGGPFDIPVVGLSFKDAAALYAQVQAGPVTVALGMPVSRAIWQSFRPARTRPSTRATSALDRTSATLLPACPSGEIGILDGFKIHCP